MGKNIKSINIVPSNKYFAKTVGGGTGPERTYYTYAIIDAIAVIVYDDFETKVGGLELGAESGCCTDFIKTLYHNLESRLCANEVEDFILDLTVALDISREEAIKIIKEDFGRTDVIIMDDAALIFDEVK